MLSIAGQMFTFSETAGVVQVSASLPLLYYIAMGLLPICRTLRESYSLPSSPVFSLRMRGRKIG